MSEENTFGRDSYSKDASSMYNPDWRIKKRTSDQVRQSYRLSQGAQKNAQYSNFTEDDIGDEGITELFNYLSDSGSEGGSRRPSSIQPQKDRKIDPLFGTRLRQFDETSNDTGTFAFGKPNEDYTLARESREKSLIKTFEGDYTEENDIFRDQLVYNDRNSEVEPDELRDNIDNSELIMVDSSRNRKQDPSRQTDTNEGMHQ